MLAVSFDTTPKYIVTKPLYLTINRIDREHKRMTNEGGKEAKEKTIQGGNKAATVFHAAFFSLSRVSP